MDPNRITKERKITVELSAELEVSHDPDREEPGNSDWEKQQIEDAVAEANRNCFELENIRYEGDL